MTQAIMRMFELDMSGSFTMEISEAEYRMFGEGRCTPLEVGGLVLVSINNGKDKPMKMWQKIIDITMHGYNRILTIGDKNINFKGQCCGFIVEAESKDQVFTKEEMRKRAMIAQDMMVKFIQLDDKEGAKKFVIDAKYLMRVFMGDEEFNMDENVRVVCPKTGKLIKLQ